MDFFESQDRARRKTGQLVFLFALATLGLVLITNFLLLGLSGHQSGPDARAIDWQAHLFLSLGVLAVIGVASLFKIAQLSGGGEVVAQSLGGRLLHSDTTDPDERRVLNVVEEMAIASGLPVPPVYILDDDALNAFAAGFESDDAVIGITRGCVRYLNREELQGVVAHEFSHIMHGDMRINIRLIGVLFGILVIGNIGYFIMRSSMYRSRSSNREGLPLVFIGIGLIVVGYIGTFFGNLIKASVSRQREFLADASAVQYTRNPQGIGNALRKIGGFRFGSRLMAPNAAEASHLFIGQAIKLSSLMATHPPLEERISRVMPDWDGSFIDTEAKFKEEMARRQRERHFGAEVANFSAATELPDIAFTPAVDSGVSASPTPSVLDSIGEIGQQHLGYAQQLLQQMDGEVRSAVHTVAGAKAAVYSLLLAQDESLRQKQLALIAEREGDLQRQVVEQLAPAVARLGIEYRLPIVDMSLPVLKTLYEDQHREFRACLLALMRSDEHINLFEWCLHRMFVRHLDSVYEKARHSRVRYRSLSAVAKQCQIICAALAAQSGSDEAGARHAFDAAIAQLGLTGAVSPYKGSPGLDEIDRALADACALAPLVKPQLIKACASSVLADGEVKPAEYELLRAIADCLDVPLPPRLAEQALY